MILSLTLWTCLAVTQATVTVDPRIQIGMTYGEAVLALREEPSVTISTGLFCAWEYCIFTKSKLRIQFEAGRVARVARSHPK
jgi:hypothetical protein